MCDNSMQAQSLLQRLLHADDAAIEYRWRVAHNLMQLLAKQRFFNINEIHASFIQL